MPEVVQDKMIQVRFSAIGYASKGVWKVMTEQDVDDRFHSEAWISYGVSTTMVDNTFQILSHHYVSVAGHVEARYITIHPAF